MYWSEASSECTLCTTYGNQPRDWRPKFLSIRNQLVGDYTTSKLNLEKRRQCGANKIFIKMEELEDFWLVESRGDPVLANRVQFNYHEAGPSTSIGSCRKTICGSSPSVDSKPQKEPAHVWIRLEEPKPFFNVSGVAFTGMKKLLSSRPVGNQLCACLKLWKEQNKVLNETRKMPTLNLNVLLQVL